MLNSVRRQTPVVVSRDGGNPLDVFVTATDRGGDVSCWIEQAHRCTNSQRIGKSLLSTLMPAAAGAAQDSHRRR